MSSSYNQATRDRIEAINRKALEQEAQKDREKALKNQMLADASRRNRNQVELSRDIKAGKVVVKTENGRTTYTGSKFRSRYSQQERDALTESDFSTTRDIQQQAQAQGGTVRGAVSVKRNASGAGRATATIETRTPAQPQPRPPAPRTGAETARYFDNLLRSQGVDPNPRRRLQPSTTIAGPATSEPSRTIEVAPDDYESANRALDRANQLVDAYNANPEQQAPFRLTRDERNILSKYGIDNPEISISREKVEARMQNRLQERQIQQYKADLKEQGYSTMVSIDAEGSKTYTPVGGRQATEYFKPIPEGDPWQKAWKGAENWVNNTLTDLGLGSVGIGTGFEAIGELASGKRGESRAVKRAAELGTEAEKKTEAEVGREFIGLGIQAASEQITQGRTDAGQLAGQRFGEYLKPENIPYFVTSLGTEAASWLTPAAASKVGKLAKSGAPKFKRAFGQISSKLDAASDARTFAKVERELQPYLEASKPRLVKKTENVDVNRILKQEEFLEPSDLPELRIGQGKIDIGVESQISPYPLGRYSKKDIELFSSTADLETYLGKESGVTKFTSPIAKVDDLEVETGLLRSQDVPEQIIADLGTTLAKDPFTDLALTRATSPKSDSLIRVPKSADIEADALRAAGFKPDKAVKIKKKPSSLRSGNIYVRKEEAGETLFFRQMFRKAVPVEIVKLPSGREIPVLLQTFDATLLTSETFRLGRFGIPGQLGKLLKTDAGFSQFSGRSPPDVTRIPRSGGPGRPFSYGPQAPQKAVEQERKLTASEIDRMIESDPFKGTDYLGLKSGRSLLATEKDFAKTDYLGSKGSPYRFDVSDYVGKNYLGQGRAPRSPAVGGYGFSGYASLAAPFIAGSLGFRGATGIERKKRRSTIETTIEGITFPPAYKDSSVEKYMSSFGLKPVQINTTIQNIRDEFAFDTMTSQSTRQQTKLENRFTESFGFKDIVGESQKSIVGLRTGFSTGSKQITGVTFEIPGIPKIPPYRPPRLPPLVPPPIPFGFDFDIPSGNRASRTRKGESLYEIRDILEATFGRKTARKLPGYGFDDYSEAFAKEFGFGTRKGSSRKKGRRKR